MRANPPVPHAREEPDVRPDHSPDTVALPPVRDALEDAPTRPTPHTRWRRWRAASQRFTRHLPFAGIFIIALYLITINVSTPWQSMHEDNGTLNESIAVNHLRYGLGVTKGQDLLDLEAKQSFGPAHGSEAQHFAYFRYGPTH